MNITNKQSSNNKNVNIIDMCELSKNLKLEEVKQYGWYIQFIENPSEEIQLEAVKQNGCVIKFIKNPSEEVQMAAVKQNSYAIRHIKKPTEKVQLLAVSNEIMIKFLDRNTLNSIGYKHPIDFIKNPSEKVIKAAIEHGATKEDILKNKTIDLEKLSPSLRLKIELM